ncbi:hypothetical protein D4R51_01030 [bacterium]|nr:MAG: hypothetical protein D4R51_01030 [bacterium]
MQNKTLIFWIIGGAAAGIIVIALALSNGIISPFGTGGNASKTGGTASNAPAGVSYNPADAYSTSTNTIVTGAPAKPSQSLPITKDKIPDAAIKLSVKKGSFDPSSFTVNAGQTVTLSLTSTDSHGHSFVFVDPSLASVNVGVGPNETRIITFTAPGTPGSYKFQCNTFGDAARGETGVMTVK